MDEMGRFLRRGKHLAGKKGLDTSVRAASRGDEVVGDEAEKKVGYAVSTKELRAELAGT